MAFSTRRKIAYGFEQATHATQSTAIYAAAKRPLN
jgi:hypothetical protein